MMYIPIQVWGYEKILTSVFIQMVISYHWCPYWTHLSIVTTRKATAVVSSNISFSLKRKWIYYNFWHTFSSSFYNRNICRVYFVTKLITLVVLRLHFETFCWVMIPGFLITMSKIYMFIFAYMGLCKLWSSVKNQLGNIKPWNHSIE